MMEYLAQRTFKVNAKRPRLGSLQRALAARPFPRPSALSNRLLPVSPKVTEISMGEFLAHSTAVWLNPHPSLGRVRRDPEMTVFGERAR